MRKTLGVCLLVLLLTGSASAGIMGNDDAAQSEPQPASQAQESPGGEIPNGLMPNGGGDSLTQIALDVLALLL